MKLYYPDSRVTARQHFLCFFVQLWNKLPEEVVSTGSVGAFISRLNSIHASFFKGLFWCRVISFTVLSFRSVVSDI